MGWIILLLDGLVEIDTHQNIYFLDILGETTNFLNRPTSVVYILYFLILIKHYELLYKMIAHDLGQTKTWAGATNCKS